MKVNPYIIGYHLFNVAFNLWISWDWFDMTKATDPIPLVIALCPGISIGVSLMATISHVGEAFDERARTEEG